MQTNHLETDQSLPALAPRASGQYQRSPPPVDLIGDRQRNRGVGASTRSRSSHRSRAGCWTCRTRKVKCDEVHPRCGQCTRLNKSCDWERRWKFDDSTRSTQDKFANVSVTGNAVWDPTARPSRSRFGQFLYDDLPSFANLATDEDRERKAEIYAPGTYNVIVGPDTFSRSYDDSTSDGRRPSVHLHNMNLLRSETSARDNSSNVTPMPGDPNTVFLSAIEDSQPTSSEYPASLDGYDSVDVNETHIALPSQTHPVKVPSASPSTPSLAIQRYTDDDLVLHYAQFVAPRLYPWMRIYHAQGIPDPVLVEARSFPPLLHAVCALSLLSLYSRGRARWESALQREAMATTALGLNVRGEEELNSVRVLCVHFLLLSYDLCDPVNDDNIWVQHMQQVKRIMQTRVRLGRRIPELCWHLLGRIGGLEVQASLTGRDTGMSWILDQHHTGTELQTEGLPIKPLPPSFPNHEQEVDLLRPALISLHYTVIIAQRIGQVAEQFRKEPQLVASDTKAISARRKIVADLQENMWYTWHRYYPQALPFDDYSAADRLVPRVKEIFESAHMFHCINVMYSSVCMWPGQLLTEPTLVPKLASYCRRCIAIADTLVDDEHWARPPFVLGVFLAGVCSPEAEVKAAAISIIERIELSSIGRNASKAKALLIAVVEEQQRRTARGGRAEEVHWITVAHDRHMEVIDFGL